uniref:Uncharacterized protein n=1 Tax=Megaselia scalaris TaxID=36166 RepID=T1GTV2_MEGSC
MESRTISMRNINAEDAAAFERFHIHTQLTDDGSLNIEDLDHRVKEMYEGARLFQGTRISATFLQFRPPATYPGRFIRIQTIEYAFVQYCTERSLQTYSIYERNNFAAPKICGLYNIWGNNFCISVN